MKIYRGGSSIYNTEKKRKIKEKEKKMKKLLSLLLALLMIVSVAFVACNDETPDEKESEDLAFNDTEPTDENPGSESNESETNPVTPNDYTFTDVDETVYVQNCNKVNIRTSPSAANKDNIAGSLTFGDGKSYKRTGYNSKWSKLEINGEEFYVNTYFLTTSPAEVVFTNLSEPKTLYVDNMYENDVPGNLNIRSFTSTTPDPEFYPNGNVAAVAKHGAILKALALSKDEKWYKVEFTFEENGATKTVTGYVANGPYVSETVPTGEPHTEPPVTEPAVG